jgi:hypothetical protein
MKKGKGNFPPWTNDESEHFDICYKSKQITRKHQRNMLQQLNVSKSGCNTVGKRLVVEM